MTLSTAHIGIAIRDFMEGRQIEGEKPSRDNPYADESYYIEFIDVSDPHNPMVHTSAGIFKLVILKVDQPTRYAPPTKKELPRTISKSLLWKPGKKTEDDSSD